MKTNDTLWLAIGGVLALITVVLYFQERGVDPKRYGQALDAVDQLVRTNHELNTRVLSVHNNLVPHYDEIVAAVREYEERFDTLRSVAASANSSGAANVETALQKVADTFADKKATLDRFKLDKAVLRNSLNYLPEAIRAARLKYRGSKPLDDTLDELEVATLSFSATGETRWRIKREETSSALEPLLVKAGIAARKDITNLKRHSDLVARHAASIRVSLSALLQHPLNAELNTLRNAVTASYADANKRSERYRAGYFGAALMSGVALFAWATGVMRARVRRREERRFRELIENSSDLITIIDRSGLIRFQSPSLKRVLGFEPSAWTGKNISTLVNVDDRLALELELRRLTMESGVRVLREFRVLDARGTSHTFESLAKMVGGDGGEPEIVLNTRDVTERNQTQHDLDHALRAALNASRAKSDFLAKMSHELRTPLNAIIGYGELLMDNARSERRESDVDDLQRIQSAGRHLLHMIDEILDLSKIEAGGMFVALGPLAIRPLVDDVISMVRPLAEKHGNTLSVSIEAGSVELYSDATKVKQTLFNLLSNACKFTRDGTVTLTVRDEFALDSRWLTFEVLDTGIGISPDQLKRIFLPFAQADANTAIKYGGTGLGLSISKTFCEMLGGTLTVESSLGAGSKFRVRLPVELCWVHETPTDVAV